MKLGYYCDLVNNVMVEVLQVLSWYPILLVDSTSYLVNFIVIKTSSSEPIGRNRVTMLSVSALF